MSTRRLILRHPCTPSGHERPSRAKASQRTAMLSLTLEPLELRRLLSGVAIPWPDAPFNHHLYAPELHENQNGFAIVTGSITPRHPVGAFDISADDGGALKLSARGTLATDLAYYDQPALQSTGQPTHIAEARGETQTTLDGQSISWDKPSNYIAVRAQSPGDTGMYTLEVFAPPANYVENIKLSPVHPSNSVYHGISGANDCDFFRIRVPAAGDWVIKTAPDPGLDATMNIYDAKGNPVGGTYTSPIDNAGRGGTESWTAANVAANTVYYVRVDGAGDSIGNYHVLVQPADPAVSIKANLSSTRAAGRHGSFIVSRTGDLSHSLTIHYHISGTAIAGRDYAALSGIATIPAGQALASITVNSVPEAKAKTDKTIVLSLVPAQGYTLGELSSAVLTLPAHKRA